MRGLGTLDLEAKTPLQGIKSTNAGEGAREGRKGDRRGFLEEGWIQQRRIEQLSGQSRHSDHASDQTLRRPASQVGFDPQWCENSSFEVVSEFLSSFLGDELTEQIEARVRVDTPPPGWRDWSVALERESGGVREEMANGGSWGTRPVVELPATVLDADQHRIGGEHLGNRSPASDRVEGTVS